MKRSILMVVLSFWPLYVGAACAQTDKVEEPAAKADYSQEPYVIEQFHRTIHFENDGTGRREVVARVRLGARVGAWSHLERWGLFCGQKGRTKQRCELNLGGGTLSEARGIANGKSAAAWNKNGGR